MADNKIRMPSSGGGLVQYFEDYKSKIEVPPKVVIGIIIVLAVLGIYFHAFY